MTVAAVAETNENLLMPETPALPDKMYFRVGEVSRLVGVPAYVLRFWETEFPALAPKKTGRGHRMFRRKDVELLLQIKHLLYERRYTIEGARQALKKKTAKAPVRAVAPKSRQKSLFAPEPPAELEQVREELRAILKLLA
jgi:DNA-binding transcriptional MerR regulator